MQSAAKMQKRVWGHVFRVCLTKVRMYAPAIVGDSSSETNSSLLSAEREVNVPPAERTVSFMSRSPKKRTANERIDASTAPKTYVGGTLSLLSRSYFFAE